MLREAKAGIIVAGSFLALLGVVVASKMRSPDPGAENPDTPVAAATPGKAAPLEPSAAPPRPLDNGIIQTALDADAAKATSPMPEPTLPAPATNVPPAAPPAPTPDEKEREQQEILRKLAESKLAQSQQNLLPDVQLPPTVPEPATAPMPERKQAAPPPGFPEEKKGDVPPPGFPKTPPMFVQNSGPPPTPAPSPNFPPEEKKETAPVPPPVKPSPPDVPAPMPEPTPEPTPIPKAQEPKSELPPAAPVVAAPTPSPETKAPEPMVKEVFPPLGANNPPSQAPMTTLPPVTSNPPPMAEPARNDVPPLGAKTPDLSPPVVGIGPAAGRPPEVKSFDEQLHRCTSEDVSFEALSRRLYRSDKYGAALLAYNRKHLMAKPGIQQDPPQLQPGDAIFYPPVGILEIQFAGLVREPVAATPTSSSSGVGIGAPRPLGSQAPVAVRPATPPPTADNVKRYVVRGQGQMMLEIARRTLGDAGRWPELYRLNPNLQPQFPIPDGTEIRLPATANVQ